MTQSGFKLIETFGLNQGKYIVFSEHIARLIRSARFLNFTLPTNKVKRQLNRIAKQYNKGLYKVRLTINCFGYATYEVDSIQPIQSLQYASLATKPIDSNYVFLYHKTTARHVYNKQKLHDGSFDTLLWNEKEQLTEFTFGNIVVEINGCFYTPPQHCGLLHGTYREHLLKKQVIQEKVLYLHDIQTFHRIWFINSVRQWIEINIK